MPLYEYLCDQCEHCEERVVEYDQRDSEFKCPNCEESNLRRVWITPPAMGRFRKEDSAETIEARKQSFRQRFVKKEMTDVRHKFGRLFDDSLVSAAATRIKDGKA